MFENILSNEVGGSDQEQEDYVYEKEPKPTNQLEFDSKYREMFLYENDWSHNFCDCCSDFKVCCGATFCLPW